MKRRIQFRKPALPATEQVISDLEKRLGVTLPASLRQFYLECNGGFVSRDFSFYPVPPKYQAYWQQYDIGLPVGAGIVEFHSAAENRQFSSLENAVMILKRSDQLAEKRLPIASEGCGNCLLISTDVSEGDKIYYWEHEFNQEFLIVESLQELLDGLTALPEE